MCRVMDDGKEGQMATDGHSDLQVQAGGRGLAEALQVGHADSLPSENTKGTCTTALFPAPSGPDWLHLLNLSAMKASAGPPFFSCTSGVNLPAPAPLPLPGPSFCSRAEVAIPFGFFVAGWTWGGFVECSRGMHQSDFPYRTQRWF